MYAPIYHSYAHLIPALGIVRKPILSWGFITKSLHQTSAHMTLAGLLSLVSPCQGRAGASGPTRGIAGGA